MKTKEPAACSITFLTRKRKDLKLVDYTHTHTHQAVKMGSEFRQKHQQKTTINLEKTGKTKKPPNECSLYMVIKGLFSQQSKSPQKKPYIFFCLSPMISLLPPAFGICPLLRSSQVASAATIGWLEIFKNLLPTPGKKKVITFWEEF